MTREEAIIVLSHIIKSYKTFPKILCKIPHVEEEKDEYINALKVAIEALQTDTTKKKAELKENGDWDCPDVDCDECDHYRSVSWCSLAIPNHEEIDDTYKMVTEAFFEGFESAEKRYKLLIEEFDKKSADAVQGEWRTDKPTEQGQYIVTVDSMRHGMVELMYYGKPMMPNRKVRGKCWYRSDDEWGDVVYDDKDILAWMPLPKPYKGGDTE